MNGKPIEAKRRKERTLKKKKKRKELKSSNVIYFISNHMKYFIKTPYFIHELPDVINISIIGINNFD